jgi:TonB-dependent starch-binding outer membrane protein SusC
MMHFSFVRTFQWALCTVLVLSANALFAQKTVFGMVTDAKGQPVVGANVVVKNSTIGTTTDLEGSYTLLNVPDSASIVISNLGYLSKEIRTLGKTTIDVKLSVPKRKKKLRNRGS